MKIWIISDTHFGHDKLVELSGRPTNFTDLLLENLRKVQGDIIIHLGDVCIGKDEDWHKAFMSRIPVGMKKILLRGNHDSKSDSWYLKHGWDFVCDEFSGHYFGKKILFSHYPLPKADYNLNIHGHLHGNNHRHEEGGVEIVEGYHIDIAPELYNYQPLLLQEVINTLSTCKER